MFKNITFYTFNADWTRPSTETLKEVLSLQRFIPCLPTQEQSSGWTPPRNVQGDAFLEESGENWILSLMIERKSVPASAVNAEVQRLQREMEAETGEKLTRKEIRALKEEAFLNLLPKAFSKKTQVTAWVDLENRRVVFDSTSSSVIDEAITKLTQLFHDADAPITLAAWMPAQEIDRTMATWLQAQEFPEDFEPNEYLELRSGGEDLAGVRYSRHDLQIEEIVAHIAGGKRVLELGLVWQDRVAFNLHESGSLKKVEVLNDVFVEDGDSFDADMVLYTKELSALLDALVQTLDSAALCNGPIEEHEQTTADAEEPELA